MNKFILTFWFFIALLLTTSVQASRSGSLYSDLYRAINNEDIGIANEKDGISFRGSQYETTGSGMIVKSDRSFILERRNLLAEDSRLNVAHKKGDGSYSIETYHLNRGFVKRATKCKKMGSNWMGARDVYSCVYASADTCRSFGTKVKGKSNLLKQCKDLTAELKDMLPLEVKNYNQFVNREAGRAKQFAREAGLGRVTQFNPVFSRENVESSSQSALDYIVAITETMDLCQDYFAAESGVSWRDNPKGSSRESGSSSGTN